MDFEDVLKQLRRDRDAIKTAIQNLERLDSKRYSVTDGRPVSPVNGHRNGTSKGYLAPLNGEE